MTCGVTRAIHLEVVSNMSTRSFMGAFRRFTDHHPLSRVIFSDNATTFQCASVHVKNLAKDQTIIDYLANRQIQWKFIPKRAPWYGGFWERLVGLIKSALQRMIGRHKLDIDDLRTATSEIEAILNDRQLTHVPSEVGGIEPLTPSHLL